MPQKIYVYKLTVDDDGAPCVTVKDKMLSLAICKPMIRSTAERGNLIFGFAAKSLDPDNRLIYVAEITEKVPNGDYFVERRFSRRGDCIYERRKGRFLWRQGAKHHGPADLIRDLGGHPDYPKASVLLSTTFRYFGANGTSDYKRKYSLVKSAVEGLGRGHRVWHDEELYDQLMKLKEETWRSTPAMVAGPPTSAPRRGVCHRNGSCGVLDAPEEA